MDTQKAERDEARRLANKGVKFTIEYDTDVPVQGWKRWLGRTEKKHISKEFEIKEPTLAVLDHLSNYWVQFKIDDSKLKTTDDIFNKAKELASVYAKQMAEVVAISVLGEDYYIKRTDATGKITMSEDFESLGELADLFAHTLSPSDLLKYAQYILATSNLGDFMASIRLMSAQRTTQPMNRVE